MKNILLIGGAGYVGTVLTSHLLKKGYKVTVLDKCVYNNQHSAISFMGDPDYNFVYGDMGSDPDLKKVSNEITDVVLLAGLVGDPITKKYPKESSTINEKGVQNVMNYFNGKGIDKLIFISTCSNYGLIKENELADESYKLNPLSLYAKAKVSNENYLIGKKTEFDYTGVVLRFATAFGLSPRMRFDLTISEFVRNIFLGKELIVYDEHTWRPYCHVRDFARLLELVIESNNSKVYYETFNAGGDSTNFTKKMIVDEILHLIPDGKVNFGSHGSDPRNYKVSFSKVKSILGFEPHYSVQMGIRELIAAFEIGMFQDSLRDITKYGNHSIDY